MTENQPSEVAPDLEGPLQTVQIVRCAGDCPAAWYPAADVAGSRRKGAARKDGDGADAPGHPSRQSARFCRRRTPSRRQRWRLDGLGGRGRDRPGRRRLLVALRSPADTGEDDDDASAGAGRFSADTSDPTRLCAFACSGAAGRTVAQRSSDSARPSGCNRGRPPDTQATAPAPTKASQEEQRDQIAKAALAPAR